MHNKGSTVITNIFAKGFKGLTFEQPLYARTLVTGRVGSGKSARALALALLVTGALPGTGIAKNNAEILNAVGSGDTLTVGISVDGKTLERTYKRKNKGSVGCDCRINGESVLKNLFDVELGNLGISIVDVAAFLSLSDARQIDELFRLFPPSGDVRKISAGINATKSAISKLESDIKAKEQSAQSLIASMSEMQLPAGSLPEVQAEIARVEREYQATRDEMIRETTRLEHEAKSAQEAEEAATKTAELPQQGELLSLLPQNFSPEKSAEMPPPLASLQAKTDHQKGISALERVLSALEQAGCGGCAARMVLKREIRNMQEVPHV